MGLFDLLFGGGSKTEPASNNQPEPAVAKSAVPDIQPEVFAAAEGSEINPEIVAAIVSSINCVMDNGINVKVLTPAALAAVYHDGGVHAGTTLCTSSAWALAGRQKLMDSRQFS